MESEAKSRVQKAQRDEPAAADAPTDSASPGTPPEMNDSTNDSVAEVEIGGRGGLDPTRYGDWEKNGRCIDF